jgi:hypothetical protein
MKALTLKMVRLFTLIMAMFIIPALNYAQEVLIIWDNSATYAPTVALKTSLENQGFTVTMSSVSESSWNNTNPSLTGFDVVIRLNGSTYSSEMPTAGQTALVDFVENDNGAYVQFEWDAYQFNNNLMQSMEDLILFERNSGSETSITLSEVSAQANHPVLANVPSSFGLTTGFNVGSIRSFSSEPSIVLMTDNGGNDALAYRDFGTGCILGFHASANYGNYTPIADTNVHQLIIDFVGHCGYCGVDAVTSSTGVSCYGDGDGSAWVSVSGGVPPYDYEWNTTSTDTIITSLTAGNYTVTVTDSVGCITVKQVTVESPASIETGILIQNSVTCFGLTNGSAAVTVTGGTAPFTYAWNNGETADTALALPIGNAIVTVTDSNGCQFLDTAEIVGPTEIVPAYTVDPVECDGDEDGAISMSVSGGIPPYSYAWSNGSTSSSISNAMNGIYLISITDNAGCLKEDSVILFPLYPSPEVDLGNDKDICEDWPIQINAGNGSSYLWSTGQSINKITVGTAGTYWVEVTNDSGCVGRDTIVVTTYKCVGINEIDNDIKVDVFPNPTSGLVTLRADRKLDDIDYTIYDITGKLLMTRNKYKVLNANSIEIDLGSFGTGNYIIELRSNNVSSRHSIVVE